MLWGITVEVISYLVALLLPLTVAYFTNTLNLSIGLSIQTRFEQDIAEMEDRLMIECDTWSQYSPRGH